MSVDTHVASRIDGIGILAAPPGGIDRVVGEFFQGRGRHIVFVPLALAVLLPAAYFLGVSLLWAGMTVGALLTFVALRFDAIADEADRIDVEQLIHHVRPGRKLAILDPQTALLQRWYFDLRLAEESERCRRHGFKMSVVFMQLDPPDKASAAHETPEDKAAQLFIHTIRKGDLAAKIDPRTYAVCLMHSNEGQARAAIRRLMGTRKGAAPDILVATCPDDGFEVASLLGAAHAVELGEPISLHSRMKPVRTTQPLSRLLASEASGDVALKPGESATQAKARVRRAAKRARVDIEVWEEAGVLRFERVEAGRLSAVDVA